MSDKFDYQRYLASREWASKKEAIRARCEGFCERCGVRPYESTHHLTYERIGNELLEDLLAVCNWCHEFISAKSDYDPKEDIAFVVVAVNRRDARESATSAWLYEMHPPEGRIVGKVIPPTLITQHLQPIARPDGTVVFRPPAWMASKGQL